jgi:hypothetical protein
MTPPVTADRLITGISWWSSDDAGASLLHRKGAKTTTKMIGMDIAASGCSGASAPTVIRQKGQTVAFTLTSGVPLSRGHAVYWYAGATAGEVFAVAAGDNTVAGVLTCGSNTWDPVTYKVSADFKTISADIPNPTVAMNVGAYGAACAAGDVVLTIRDWTDTQGATIVTANATANISAATCYACDSTGNVAATCSLAEAVAATKGVATAASGANAVTFTMKQNGAKDTAVLTVKDLAYQPNTKGAIGRFYYKPSTAMKLYSGYSTIAYTFGSQTFGSGAICQVFTTVNNQPSMVPSALVSDCVISGSTVTVTMAGTSANFHVQITAMDAWLAAAGKVTGTVTNFGTAV